MLMEFDTHILNRAAASGFSRLNGGEIKHMIALARVHLDSLDAEYLEIFRKLEIGNWSYVSGDDFQLFAMELIRLAGS